VADAQSVAGALVIYLLLALFFPRCTSYFSGITLPTVGFGDITPACAVAPDGHYG
jgi:hypothetical protein